MNSRRIAIAAALGTCVLIVPIAAEATAVNNSDGSIVFYTGTSGSDRGSDFHRSGNQKLCADGPGSALQQFDTRYRQNRSLQGDITKAELRPSYYQARQCSGAFAVSSGNTYHLDITWSQASGAQPNRENGVTEPVAG